jgi:hypothetical protein
LSDIAAEQQAEGEVGRLARPRPRARVLGRPYGGQGVFEPGM